MVPQRMIQLFLLTFLVLLPLNVHGMSSYKNESPIAFDTKPSVFYGNIQFCWKNGSGAVPLKDIGISIYDIIRGISCIVGDFDGNGFADFAFAGKMEIDGIDKSYLKVLFYEKGKMSRSILLPGDGYFLYRATKSIGIFGEPASKTDGLFCQVKGAPHKYFYMT